MVYRTNLVGPVFGLRREIDRLFEDALGGSDAGRSTWSPAVDIREDDRGLTFEFELPGFRPEQVEVTAENGVLTVRGERRAQRKEDDTGRYHLVERSAGTFQRSFQLPQGLDEDNIEASFEHGLLEVRIPKAARMQPRRIEIRSGAPSSAGSGEVRGQPTAQQSSARRAGANSGAGAEGGKEGPAARAAAGSRQGQG